MRGSQAHDELPLSTTRWTCSDKRGRVHNRSGLDPDGMLPCDHQPNGIGTGGTACMHKAEMSDFHQAIGQDVVQEPTDELKRDEVGGPLPNTSRFLVGEGDGAAFERDDAMVGDGDFADIRGEIFAGRVAT
jgi:hypothetical protein